IVWKPAKIEEIYDYQSKVWEMLCDNMEKLETEEQKRVADILLKQSFRLSVLPNLELRVFNCVSAMKDNPAVDKKNIVSAVSDIVRHKSGSLSIELASRWEKLNDEL